jgi:hypothetical protein
MIYIQSNTDRTIPHHFDASCAMWGAIYSGRDYRLTSYEEVHSGKFDNLIKKCLFVGSVEFLNEVFSRVGVFNVRVPKNSNRESEIITLDKAHERVKNGSKLFIKSFEIKQFTGLILDGCIYSCLENLPPQTKVIAYEPFKKRIESEWRLYIHNRKIIDAKNYSGDFMIMPNWKYAESVLKENIKDFPCAYTIDIGILSDNENVVIEFNDMWAIGNYGIPNDLYLAALKDRYFEIIK